MSFSVVIASKNEGFWLEKTVRGVLENTNYPDFDIIVVADGCTDGSAEFLKQKAIPNVLLIENEKSLGAIGARNLGAQKSSQEFLVFIDSHEIPQTDNWLSELKRLLEIEGSGAATLKIPYFEEKDRVGYLYSIEDYSLEPTWVMPKNTKEPCKTPVIPGGCFAISREFFNTLNGFDAGLRKWGREDLELSWRIWRMGKDLWFSPHAAIEHAFDHKRGFDISWDEVDYNILRTAFMLTSSDFSEKIVQNIKQKRPKNVSRILSQIESDPAFLKRKQQLDGDFERDFNDYLAEFRNLLPLI